MKILIRLTLMSFLSLLSSTTFVSAGETLSNTAHLTRQEIEGKVSTRNGTPEAGIEVSLKSVHDLINFDNPKWRAAHPSQLGVKEVKVKTNAQGEFFFPNSVDRGEYILIARDPRASRKTAGPLANKTIEVGNDSEPVLKVETLVAR